MTRHRSAAALIVSAAVLFAIMALLAKQAAARLPGPEIACIRFLIGIGACAVAATRIRLRARNWRGLFWRGAFGGAAVLCYFLAIEHLSVGIATLLNYTAPVFAAAWAAAFLGEPLGPRTVVALGITAAGVALVVLGGAGPGFAGVGRWELVGICSAILSGAAVATIREVRRTDGSWEIFAAFCIGGALITAVPTARHYVPPHGVEWLLIFGVGLLSVVAQLLMTYSLRFLPAAVAGILMQITPVAALGFGVVFTGDRPTLMSLAGAGVTLLGVTWGAWLAG